MKTAYASPYAVRRARKAAGVTQTQAAALVGYSRRSWQQWEGGQRQMRTTLLALFVKAHVDDQRNLRAVRAYHADADGDLDGYNGA